MNVEWLRVGEKGGREAVAPIVSNRRSNRWRDRGTSARRGWLGLVFRQAHGMPLAEARRETAAPGWRRTDNDETLVSKKRRMEKQRNESREAGDGGEKKKRGKEGKKQKVIDEIEIIEKMMGGGVNE